MPTPDMPGVKARATVERSSAPSTREAAFSTIVRDAAIVVVAASCLGFVVNVLRRAGSIPFIQRKPYEIVVPCAEPVGDSKPLPPSDARLFEDATLVIDARSKSEYETFHWPRAINIPFDWLGPPVTKETNEIAERVARSRARSVVVYGDGDDPDSGAEWARLLAGSGLKNVYYVQGGAPTLRSKAKSGKEGSP
jgi:hypothetical protein